MPIYQTGSNCSMNVEGDVNYVTGHQTVIHQGNDTITYVTTQATAASNGNNSTSQTSNSSQHTAGGESSGKPNEKWWESFPEEWEN